MQLFDENRFTRDAFLGMVELPLNDIPKEQEGHVIPTKQYELKPRRYVNNSCESRVQNVYVWFIS